MQKCRDKTCEIHEKKEECDDFIARNEIKNKKFHYGYIFEDSCNLQIKGFSNKFDQNFDQEYINQKIENE